MDGTNYWQSRLSRRSAMRAGVLAGVGGLGLAVVGCSSSTNNTGSSSNASATKAAASAAAPSTAGTAAAAAATQAVTPKPGGTISFWSVGDTTLDPFKAATFRAQILSGYYYGRLLKLKSGPKLSDYYQYDSEPDVAQSVESPDLTTWTFKLRPNVLFHDIPPVSGRAIDADDVVATYKRFISTAENVNKNNLTMIDTVTAPDKQTVVFKLKFPYAPFKNIVATPSYFWLMPKEADNGYDPTKTPIGTGPWILDSYTPAVGWKFKRNPKYWQTGKPYIDTANFSIIPDAANQLAQFLSGNLDIHDVPPSDVATIKKQKPDATIDANVSATYGFIWGQLRDKNSAWNDERLRQAVSYAVDRKTLLDIAYVGEGKFLTSFPASFGKWYLDPQGKDFGENAKFYKYDPKAAKQLLDASGQANTTFKFIYTNNAYGDTFNQYVDATRGMLADAGFKLQVVTLDYNKEYIDNKVGIFYNGNLVDNTSLVYSLETGFSEVDEHLFNELHPTGPRNHNGVNDPALVDFIDKQRNAASDADRKKVLDDVQRYTAGKMYHVPTMIGNRYIAWQKWVKGATPAAGYDFATAFFANAWIDKS